MKNNEVIVSIVMGSDSDLRIMKEAGQVCEELDIEYEITIVSAHRTPELMEEYVHELVAQNVKVVIAGAGGAAHLPGVLAGRVSIPVIGVPIKGSILDGLDSLLSIVQMPSGVPVATVSINGARNAALLAARILSLSDKKLGERLQSLVESNKKKVIEKSNKLRELGYKEYFDRAV